ncbi:MAG: DUF2341 domain-containing protein [Candidatus Shapirobacteria bacterium]
MKLSRLKSLSKKPKQLVAFLETRLSWRTTLTLLAFFLALISIFVYWTKNVPLAEAAWFNDNWLYRKAVSITNAGTAQTDYQVALTLDTATPIAAGKMQADCADIRITDINGRIIPHWIEENNPGCDDAATKIWAKVPTIPTSGATVYVYYGNPSTSDSQNGNEVFDFFDDFNSTLDIAKWTSSESPTINSGVLELNSTSTKEGIVGSTALDTQNSIMTFKTKISSATLGTARNGFSNTTDLSLSFFADDDAYVYNYSGSNDQVFTSHNENIANNDNNNTEDTNYHVYQLVWSTSNTKFYQDGNLEHTASTQFANETCYPRFEHEAAGGALTNSIDWVTVRKYAATEPSAGEAGSEQQSPGPAAYWKFDEGYGTQAKDSTQNSHHFTSFTGSPAWQTEDMCISGKCLRFPTQASYASFTVNSTSPLNLGASNFTISNWQKVFQPVTHGSGIMGRYPHNTSYNGNFSTGISDNLTTYFFMHRNTSGSLQSYGIDYTSYFGKWIYVSWVKSGSSLYLYVDGELKQTFTPSISFDITFSGVPFYLSNTGWAPGTMANLTIDDLKIYPYARTAEQIKTDYNSGASAVLGKNTNQKEFLSDGLVGYWKIDESSGNSALDSSGNGFTGSVTAGTTISSGKFGNTRDFNSTNTEAIIVTDNDTLEINSTTSYSGFAWIKPDSTASRIQIIGKRHGGCDEGFNFDILSDATIRLNLAENSVEYRATSTATIPTTSWTFVGFTIDRTNNKATVYVNGQASGTQADITNMADMSNACPLYIAAWGPLGNGYFDGKIDEVRIYNRALSPDEVRNLYDWAPGPYAYLDFDEVTDTTIKDISGNNYSGLWNGTGTHWTEGKFGGGAKFDGSTDYVSFSSLPKPANLPITIMFWTKPTTSTPIGIFDSAPGSQDVLRNYGSGEVEWWNSEPDVSLGLTANQWTHLAFIYSYSGGNQTVDWYKNGIKQTSESAAGDGTWAWTTFRLGNINGGSSGWYSGALDDFKIYNYARTQEQIVQDMNAGHPAPGSPVGSALAHWKFDEGYGNTVNDSGYGGNNGTIVNAAWTNAGKLGKALSYIDDSGNRVDFSTDYSEITTELTISAWANLTAAADGEGRLVAGTFDWDATPANVRGWYFGEAYGSSDVFQFVLYDSSGNAGFTIISNYYANNGNQWVYLTGVYKASEYIRLYQNGVLISEDTSSIPAAIAYSGATNFRIGMRADNTSQGEWVGSIDEVKIYSSALSADQIKQDYNMGKVAKIGSLSTDASGNPSDSADRSYCPPGDTTETCSPVAEWKFDEKNGSTAYDTSGNGNNANFSNMESSDWKNGKISGALDFDGSNEKLIVTDSGTSTLDLSSSGTIEVWAKSDRQYPSDDTNPYYRNFVSKSWGGSAATVSYAFHWWGTNTDSDLRFCLSNGTLIDCDIHDIGALTIGEWNHYSVTWNGTNVKWYINGRNVETDQNTISAQLSDNPFYIGGCSFGCSTNQNWDGMLDHVRIYNYARTPAQIAWDYNRGEPVGHWKLDEGEGITAYDASGNGNNGTLNNLESADWVEAKYNTGLDLDGADEYVSIGSTASNIKTLSFWAKPSSTTQKIIELSASDSVEISSGTVTITGFGTETVYVDGKLSTSFPDTNWHHVTIISSSDITANTPNIGKIAGDYFSGQIDDVRIYNYALTSQQIQTLYNEGSAMRLGE